jgi:hypothetical protein
MIRLACLLLASLNAWSPVSAQESPIHDELRTLRDKLFAAYESRNIDELLHYVHPEVVATWQNGTRVRGHAEVRNFIDEMLSGKMPIVRDVKSQLTVDGLSVLHGQSTAVACGNIADQFELTSGSTLKLESQWTATVVLDQGAWKVASFHVSANLFDNPVLAAAKSWAGLLAAGTAVGGLILGWLLGRKLLPARN